MTVILGVDPGTHICGYGLVQLSEARRFSCLAYGCIKTNPKDLLSLRYLQIYEGISEVIARYNVDQLAVESQFVHKNVKSAMKLGMARGAVMIAAAKAERPIYEYAPKQAKLAVVGHGSGSKSQVQSMVKVLLGLSELPEPEDAADALALAICHGQTQSRQLALPCQI